MAEYPNDWKVGKVSDFYEVGSSKRVFQSDWRSSGVPFYRARELVEFEKTGACNNELFIDESLYCELKAKYGVPSVGDMLVTGVGTLGVTYVVRNRCPFYFKDGNIIWFKKKGEYDTDFLQYLYSYEDVRCQINDSAGGSTVGTYTISNAERTVIPVPPLPEQKRIAEILSTADKLIENVEKRIAKKRAIKQGAMQELLTGKKRLPGFTGEWKVNQLEEIVDVLDNMRVPIKDSSRHPGPYPYCGANGIVDYISKYVFNESVILIAEDGGNFADFATRPIAYRMNGKFWVNNHAHVLKAKEGENQEFIYHALAHKDITDVISGGTRAKLTRRQLGLITMMMPIDITEQRAIAKILSDMDEEISNLERKLEKLKLMKKGMMQDLLTGKVRLRG